MPKSTQNTPWPYHVMAQRVGLVQNRGRAGNWCQPIKRIVNSEQCFHASNG